MITNWDKFEEWREQSIEYHKNVGDYGYYNALTYFEHAREFFNKNGFPDENPRGKPTKKNPLGNIRKYKPEENRKQKEEINEFIKSKQFKKVQKRYRRK